MVWDRRVFLAPLIAGSLLALGGGSYAFDKGQYENVSEGVRAWFKSVKSHYGIPCCDMADGHKTEFDFRGTDYWVPIDGNWMPVPKDAVVNDSGNPVGQAVVWYSNYGGKIFIRCFVPGGGV
jgi:hypothetical protein